MRRPLSLLCAAAAISAAAARQVHSFLAARPPLLLPSVQAADLEAELAQLGRDIATEEMDSAVERLGLDVAMVSSEGEREESATAEHDWCVLLTATVTPFVDVTNIVHHDLGPNHNPQKNVVERRHTYEHSVSAAACCHCCHVLKLTSAKYCGASTCCCLLACALCSTNAHSWHCEDKEPSDPQWCQHFHPG